MVSKHPVVELRNYRLRPQRRDELIALFEREFVETQEAQGIELLGLFRVADRPDAFVWLRRFADMDARAEALEAFYGGSVWRAHREAANATMIDSDNVLLLRGLDGPIALAENPSRGPLLCLTKLFPNERDRDAFAARFEAETGAQIAAAGGCVLAAFVTEYAANTFPRLPVREGVHAFVALTGGIACDARVLRGSAFEVMVLVPTERSRIRLPYAGRRGDFDFLCGIRTVTHHRLRERLHGCTQWDTATGAYRGYSLAGGALSVDEMALPGPDLLGCSIRNLDVDAMRWSIHWTTSRSGKLFAPVHGGFNGDRGEFYGEDVEGEAPVLVRYVWSDCATKHPRWEQAFSTDGGRSWEPNWIMEFR